MTYKKCPHCNGDTGFDITLKVSGYNNLKLDFSGRLIGEQKNENEEAEKFGKCLDCGKPIISTSLQLKKTGTTSNNTVNI